MPVRPRHDGGRTGLQGGPLDRPRAPEVNEHPGARPDAERAAAVAGAEGEGPVRRRRRSGGAAGGRRRGPVGAVGLPDDPPAAGPAGRCPQAAFSADNPMTAAAARNETLRMHTSGSQRTTTGGYCGRRRRSIPARPRGLDAPQPGSVPGQYRPGYTIRPEGPAKTICTVSVIPPPPYRVAVRRFRYALRFRRACPAPRAKDLSPARRHRDPCPAAPRRRPPGQAATWRGRARTRRGSGPDFRPPSLSVINLLAL
jgi:hypothetical protein